MVRNDKRVDGEVGESGDKGSHRISVAKLPAVCAFLFVLVGLIADISGAYEFVRGIWPQKNRLMSGDINVLYVPFVSDRTVVKELATVINESYGDEMRQRLPRALDELIGNDSGYNVQVRVLSKLDLDPGSSSAERVEFYQKVMRDHDSDIVVSGRLADAENSVVLQSELFISEGSLEDAAELGGMHYLDLSSTPLDLERSPEGRRRIRAQVIGQVESYAWLIAAISLYVYGDNSAALSGLERVRNEWSSLQGRKVIDVFLGNVWGRLNDAAKAQSYYVDAIEIDPSYARARLGLAEMNYQRGNGRCQSGSLVHETMEQNISQYDAIFRVASGEPSDAQDILERAAFGRGRANLCLALAMPDPDRFASARNDFSFVISQVAGGKDRLRSLAGESHANRGLSWLSEGTGNNLSIERYTAAEQDYRAAIRLVRDGARQGVFYGMLGFIESRLGGSVARSCYLMAKKLDPERSHEYDEALAQLGDSSVELPC